MSLWEFLSDFLMGGTLIAVVLALGHFIGPLTTGIIAALPVRVWATILLGGVSASPDFLLGMLRGIISGSVGTLGFIVILATRTRRYGVRNAFILACAVCAAITCVGVFLA